MTECPISPQISVYICRQKSDTGEGAIIQSHKDEQFLQQIYDEYADHLYRYALSRLKHSHNDAVDCVQQVFLTATIKAAQLKTHPNIGGWLMQTMNHYLHQYYRQQRIRPLPLSNAENELTPFPADNIFSNSEIAEYKQVILHSLSEREQTLYVLFYEQAVPIKEIALIDGVSEMAIKMRLYRLRIKITDVINNIFS